MRGGRYHGRRAETISTRSCDSPARIGPGCRRTPRSLCPTTMCPGLGAPLSPEEARQVYPPALAALVPPRERHAGPVPGSARVPGRGGEGGALRRRHRRQRRRWQEHSGPGTAGPDLPLADAPRGRVGEHRRLSLPQPRAAIAGFDGTQGVPRELRPAAPSAVPR